MLASCLATTALLLASRSSAQDRPTLSGSWSATPMVERWNFGDWGEKCGPKPSPQGSGGGSVTINQMGNELSMSGAGRSYSTTNCWEQYPGLQRSSHSASPRGWANRCTTPASDPRRATIITTISATDDAISFDETGSYQFIIEGQNCTASVRRNRSFRLIQRQGETPPAASTTATASTPTPTATPPAATTQPPAEKSPPEQSHCSTPGEAARLEVRPARKLMRAGEEFQFRASVLDARGCMLKTQPTWRLGSGEPKLKLSADGTVRVDNASAEGTAELVASVSGQQVKVVVEVASNEHYESLLSARGLNQSGEMDEAVVAVIATGSLGSGATVVENTARKRKTIFAAVVGGAAILLAIASVIVLKRTSKKKPIDDDEEEDGAVVVAEVQPRPHPRPAQSSTSLLCPVCQEEYPAGSTFCAKDGTRLVSAAASKAESDEPGGICPVCERGFESSMKTCPEHGETLVPAHLFHSTARAKVVVEKRGKICPTCGMRYDGEAAFCGKDGTSLVLIN